MITKKQLVIALITVATVAAAGAAVNHGRDSGYFGGGESQESIPPDTEEKEYIGHLTVIPDIIPGDSEGKDGTISDSTGEVKAESSGKSDYIRVTLFIDSCTMASYREGDMSISIGYVGRKLDDTLLLSGLASGVRGFNHPMTIEAWTSNPKDGTFCVGKKTWDHIVFESGDEFNVRNFPLDQIGRPLTEEEKKNIVVHVYVGERYGSDGESVSYDLDKDAVRPIDYTEPATFEIKKAKAESSNKLDVTLEVFGTKDKGEPLSSYSFMTRFYLAAYNDKNELIGTSYPIHAMFDSKGLAHYPIVLDDGKKVIGGQSVRVVAIAPYGGSTLSTWSGTV